MWVIAAVALVVLWGLLMFATARFLGIGEEDE